MTTIDFFGRRLNAYRANLHTHTTTSDGKYTPDEITAIYSKAGYDVLCFSDHLKTNRLADIAPNGLLLLSGAEMHPCGGRVYRSHLLCINLPEDFDAALHSTILERENRMQSVVDAVTSAGGLCYVAHPYWCGFRAEEIAELRDIAGIEVYNTSTRVIGKEYNMQTWDELCDLGYLLPALAVDDVHQARDLFGGWVEICCEKRTSESVIDALRRGSYYSTQGPRFTRVSYENGVFKAEFTPVVGAFVVSNQCHGMLGNMPNNNGDGQTAEVTCCRFDLSKLHAPWQNGVPCNYFRIQIKDAQGRYAWLNPIPFQ